MFELFGRKKDRAKPLVLAIDDDEDIRGLISAILWSMELDVVCAPNGPDGLALARKERPDLVLLDIRMPGTSGFEICRALKDDPRTGKIPVVMVTALDQHKDVEVAVMSGADGYVVKPLDNQQFKKKIRDVLKLPPPSAV